MSVQIHPMSSSLKFRFSSRSARRAAALAVLAATLVACDRPKSDSPGDSTGANGLRSGGDSVSTIVTASGWDIENGPFIVLPTVDGGMTAGSLLRPEATELTVGDTTGIGRVSADGRLDLFSRSGKIGEARFSVDASARVDPGCTAWPVARLVAGNSALPAASWTAAFAAGRVDAIVLDSIEGMAPRDSARFAASLTRIASALSDDTSKTFRGLPFVVLRAYRSRGLDKSFVVAILVRRVNQEADPREERLVMVVDLKGDDPTGWEVGWKERASGREDELIVAEPLLAYRISDNADIHLLFGRDDGVALSAAVLVRDQSGWHVQWESAVAGCG